MVRSTLLCRFLRAARRAKSGVQHKCVIFKNGPANWQQNRIFHGKWLSFANSQICGEQNWCSQIKIWWITTLPQHQLFQNVSENVIPYFYAGSTLTFIKILQNMSNQIFTLARHRLLSTSCTKCQASTSNNLPEQNQTYFLRWLNIVFFWFVSKHVMPNSYAGSTLIFQKI